MPATPNHDHGSDRSTSLTLTARIDRPLIYSGGGSVRYLVATLAAPDRPESNASETPHHLNLAIVIDASGSMGGARIRAAQEAASRVINGLTRDDRLSLVRFGDWAVTLMPPAAPGVMVRADAHDAIASIRPRGSTDLGGGWILGCENVAGAMDWTTAAMRHRVLVLSDGKGNRGITSPAELARHASALRDRGIISSAVGVGADYYSDQLEAIAIHGGGVMHHAAEPEEIARVVLGELREMREATVERSRLALTVPQGMRAEVLGDWSCEMVGDRLICDVGALWPGQPRSVVIRLWCPAGVVSTRTTVRVSCDWSRTATSGPESAHEAVSLEWADDEACEAQRVEPGLGTVVARAWHLSLARQAVAANQAGKGHLASAMILDQLPHFVGYVEGLPDAQSMIGALRRVREEAEWSIPRSRGKEILIGSLKGIKGERDWREEC